MDAIKLLEQQHKEVAALFQQFDKTEDKAEKLAYFDEIADNLAIHAAIEERHFYPQIRTRQTSENLEESYDEHLEIKKLLLDAMSSTKAPGFGARVAALKGAVEHHVEEEESELFPKVRELLDADVLEIIGQRLESATAVMKERGAARADVTGEIEPPAAPHP
jgi:hemerythrin superfamily protein